jgi:hypothetical protein
MRLPRVPLARGNAPEDHASGLLNGFQALAQQTGVSVPKLDVVLIMLGPTQHKIMLSSHLCWACARRGMVARFSSFEHNISAMGV